MITCFSGLPGSGKTSAVVQMILDESKKENARPVFVHGIPDLTIPHQPLDDPLDWMACPDGSLIVIDEAQHHWPVAPSGQKMHPSIQELQTHRHRGFDFIIMTQGPQLLHTAVRAQVKRHIHLRDLGVLGRWWYEWPELSLNVGSSWKSAPVRKKYKLPKKIFSSYKSATIHTKSTFTVPRAIYYLAAAVIVFCFLGWNFYKSMKAKVEPQKTTLQNGQIVNASTNQLQNPVKEVDERVDFIPRVRGRPWTAPAYDHLRIVVAMPSITGAICVSEKCTCYSGQNTLPDVADKDCLEWAKTKPFNPYVLPASPATVSGNTQSSQYQNQPVSSSTASPFSSSAPAVLPPDKPSL
jgi:zona occludens toxin